MVGDFSLFTLQTTFIETIFRSDLSIYEIGRTSHNYSELAGRTEPMVTDVAMAIIDIGMSIATLQTYANRSNKVMFVPPSQSIPTKTPRLLEPGPKRPHPSHVPDHLPPYPDIHTYIETPSHKEPEQEYQSIREKAASHKRDVERALTRFIAKTGDTDVLFPDDPLSYPLIATSTTPIPYLSGLLPKDQDLEPVTETQTSNIKVSKRKRQTDTEGQGNEESKDRLEPEAQGSEAMQGSTVGDELSELSDNPFLKPTSLPRKKKTKIF